MLRRERVGRNYRYVVDLTASLRHPAWRGVRAADLLAIG